MSRWGDDMGKDRIDVDRDPPQERPNPRSFRLTQKQRDFCEIFVQTNNQRRAVMEVFDVTKTTNADQQAWQLRQKPKIKAYIAELLERRKQQFAVTEERITEELFKIAFDSSL